MSLTALSVAAVVTEYAWMGFAPVATLAEEKRKEAMMTRPIG